MLRLLKKWKEYRYRFVPWIAFNLQNKDVRHIPQGASDKLIPDENVLLILVKLFDEFHRHRNVENNVALHKLAGFCIEKRSSNIENGGQGVFVSKGKIQEGSVTALYPGTVYSPSDPLFFQSLGNPFIFRCVDGQHIDGRDAGLSKLIYKSCANRDKIGFYIGCDISWLSECRLNPLAVGQYVNNQSSQYPANVAYQEVNISDSFPVHLMQYIPNVHFKGYDEERTSVSCRSLKMVVLVALRDIQYGEELFSNYFTVLT